MNDPTPRASTDTVPWRTVAVRTGSISIQSAQMAACPSRRVLARVRHDDVATALADHVRRPRVALPGASAGGLSPSAGASRDEIHLPLEPDLPVEPVPDDGGRRAERVREVEPHVEAARGGGLVVERRQHRVAVADLDAEAPPDGDRERVDLYIHPVRQAVDLEPALPAAVEAGHDQGASLEGEGRLAFGGDIDALKGDRVGGVGVAGGQDQRGEE